MANSHSSSSRLENNNECVLDTSLVGRFMTAIGAHSINEFNGRNISIPPKIFEEFNIFIYNNKGTGNIDHGTFNEYFYPSLKLDGVKYTYQECEDAINILKEKPKLRISLEKKLDWWISKVAMTVFWTFRKFNNEIQSSFTLGLKQFITWGKNKVSKQIFIPLFEKLEKEWNLALSSLKDLIDLYNARHYFQDIDGTYFAKDISVHALDMVVKIQNQEKDVNGDWTIRWKLQNHMKNFDDQLKQEGLSRNNLNQLQVILSWYYDRKEKEQRDIASIPGISSGWYKDNIDDYIDTQLPERIRNQKREKLKLKIDKNQNPTKSLIEMFSAWIIERVIIKKEHPDLQNIRVISTTPSDDCFSWDGEGGSGIDCICLIGSSPIGIDIVNTISKDYLGQKWSAINVIPRNFLWSFEDKTVGIWALTNGIPRYLFNITPDTLVSIFQRFVDWELLLIDKNVSQNRLVRQNQLLDRIIKTDLTELTTNSGFIPLTEKYGLVSIIKKDISQASHNILHASGTNITQHLV
jgi:hypothetical protein